MLRCGNKGNNMKQHIEKYDPILLAYNVVIYKIQRLLDDGVDDALIYDLGVDPESFDTNTSMVFTATLSTIMEELEDKIGGRSF